MEIEIIGKPLAVTAVNMKGFREQYAQTLDLQKSVEDNFSILEKGKFSATDLFKYAYYGLDWGRILDLLNSIEKDEMVIRYFACKYKGKVELAPDHVSEDGRLFIFKQTKNIGKDVLMVNSFVNHPDFDIKSYLNYTTYNFGKIRWKPMLR